MLVRSATGSTRRENGEGEMKQKKKGKAVKPKKVSLPIRTVENPDWSPDKDGEPGFPRTVTVEVNVRESAVETLYARKFLGMAQKLAADRFRALWEAAGGKASSIDYTLDRVDGGKGDPVASKLIAAQELRRVRYLVGQRGYDVLQAVCGEGQGLSDLSPHKRDRLTMADNLRADLDDCASMWGMQTRQRHIQRKVG